jgi:hypothetical protein
MKNVKSLFDFLQIHLKTRLEIYAGSGLENTSAEVADGLPVEPEWVTDDSLTQLREVLKPNTQEWLILALALAPHYMPGFMEEIARPFIKSNPDLPLLGGQKDADQRMMHPTGDTALFLLAGTNIIERLVAMRYFDSDHFFHGESMIKLEENTLGDSIYSGRLIMQSDYVELFTRAKVSPPQFSATFPAHYLHTDLNWEDLVVSENISGQLLEIQKWAMHHKQLLVDWKMQGHFKPGFMALLYGPPGTGKTLACTLMGKYTDRQVYRVDLSAVVSKYIGETEKNLANLFEKAESKNWILFFDEGDALFGKRTNVKSSNDRFANQEVSYLLQRIESFAGLVVLASNNKGNIDDAFLRRFNAVIEFPFPDYNERLQIWRNSFPTAVDFGNIEDYIAKAARYEISGGSIVNVVQFVCIQSIARGDQRIQFDDMELGIRRELEKEGKIFRQF